MSDPSVKLQANFKTPLGSLLNVYGSDPSDFINNLGMMQETLATIAGIEALLNGGTLQVQSQAPAQQLPQAQPQYAPQTATPTQAIHTVANTLGATVISQGPAQAGAGVTCNCGLPAKLIPAGVYKSGMKAGQPRPAAYACPQPQGSSCKFWQNA